MTGRGSDFWSRRKAAVREAEEAEKAAQSAGSHAELVDGAAVEQTDAEILAELELPDPDELAPGDDFTRFMAAAVPERIRLRALRQLWRSNPVLANLDGLVDYGEDFARTSGTSEIVNTAYRVGKGFAERLAEPEKPLSEPPDDTSGPLAQGGEPADEPDAALPPAATEPQGTARAYLPLTEDPDWVQDTNSEGGESVRTRNDDADTPEQAVSIRRRRMRFDFPDPGKGSETG